MTPDQPTTSASTTTSLAVVMAAFNSEQTIARALRSTLCEDAIKRIVVVDDASTDATAKEVMSVISECGNAGSKIDFVSLPANKGPAQARNHAVDRLLSATGDTSFTHVLFLDADDLLPAGAGQVIRTLIDEHPDAVMFVGARDEFDSGATGEDAERKAPMRHVAPPPRWTDRFLDNTSDIFKPLPFFGTSGMIIARKALEPPHNIRFDPRLRIGEDRDLAYRAAQLGKVFITSQTLVHVAIHSATTNKGTSNLTGPAHLKRWLGDHMYLVEKHESADLRNREPMRHQTVWLVGHVCRELAKQGTRLDIKTWRNVRIFMHRRGWQIPWRAIKWRYFIYWWHRVFK